MARPRVAATHAPARPAIHATQPLTCARVPPGQTSAGQSGFGRAFDPAVRKAGAIPAPLAIQQGAGSFWNALATNGTGPGFLASVSKPGMAVAALLATGSGLAIGSGAHYLNQLDAVDRLVTGPAAITAAPVLLRLNEDIPGPPAASPDSAPPIAVPEPASLLLFGAGSLAAVLARRLRTRCEPSPTRR